MTITEHTNSLFRNGTMVTQSKPGETATVAAYQAITNRGQTTTVRYQGENPESWANEFVAHLKDVGVECTFECTDVAATCSVIFNGVRATV